jgi:tRNA threonylcarbamoyl adenosine modification protein (Sua5/YciO/YrdC/YwlC family)
MSQYFEIHPENPQLRLLRQAATILEQGGVIAYPTDSTYALGCLVGEKKALERIKQIRQLKENHHFTLMCRDLSDLGTYAQVTTPTFRLLKAFTPGPYTFFLPATREVPRRLVHPKRKTIGLRVPDHAVTQALLETLAAPLMSSSLILPNYHSALVEPEVMKDILGKRVDLIISAGQGGTEETTVLDLTRSETPEIVRRGKGDVSDFE